MPSGPGGTPNLVLDLDPIVLRGVVADGAAISSCPDSSGLGYTAVQATGAKQPLFQEGVLNGYPVFECPTAVPPVSGQGTYLHTPDILIPADGCTVISLQRRTGAAPLEHGSFYRFAPSATPYQDQLRLREDNTPYVGWHINGATALQIIAGATAVAWFFHAITFNSRVLATQYYNGAPAGDAFIPYATAADLLCGFEVGNSESMVEVGRALLFDVPLTCTQVRAETIALAIRYGLTATLSQTSGCLGLPGGVTAYTHTFQNGTMRSAVSLGGQPKSSYKRWKPLTVKKPFPKLPIDLPPPTPIPPGGIIIETLVEETTIHVASYTDTAIVMPAGVTVIGVAVLVLVAIPGPTTAFSVGDSADVNRFQTANVPVAVGSSDPGTKAGAYYNATARAVRLSMIGGSPATNVGRVRVTITYFTVG